MVELGGATPARLIPVKGIGTTKEAEERATSALLAVLGAVRPYSRALLDSLGASRADRAEVRCYTEVRLRHPSGKHIRPDGLIEVSYGSQRPWRVLVEVKTGSSFLRREQVEQYIELARAHDLAGVLTVSNELEPVPGSHPSGIRVPVNSKVLLAHLSWQRLLTAAVTEREHRGVSDPEQAWLLSELIRYLNHPGSGTLAVDDMGGGWASVRDAAKAGTIKQTTRGVKDVVARWSELVRYVSLRLSSATGTDVQLVLTRAQRADGDALECDLMQELCAAETLGRLSSSLRVPDAIGDVVVCADLRAEQIVTSISIDAPEDKGSRGQVGWLLRQLPDGCPGVLSIEVWPQRARQPSAQCTLANARKDSASLVDGGPASRFVLELRRPMGRARKDSGRSKGFAQTVVASVEELYDTTIQHLRPYAARAPRFSPRPPVPADVGDARGVSSANGAAGATAS